MPRSGKTGRQQRADTQVRPYRFASSREKQKPSREKKGRGTCFGFVMPHSLILAGPRDARDRGDQLAVAHWGEDSRTHEA